MWFILLISAFLIFSCSSPKEDNSTTRNSKIDLVSEKDSIAEDSLKTIALANADTASKVNSESNLAKTNYKKEQKVPDVYCRYLQFPGDDNFNGKPMTHQIEIKKEILESNPDTLKLNAVDNYSRFDMFFPVSIADNFDEGISTEIIHYTDLIFRFEVFEDEFAAKPHTIKEITVRKKDNGELIAE